MNQWEELQRAAFGKRISRRDFMRRATALGVSTALATGVLSKAGYAQEPKKGGKFVIGIGHGATTDSLDPATYPDQMTGVVGWGASANSLTEMDEKGNVVPDLAESFEPSDDAKTWVFKLRKGVTFHDGRTVTADDVVASYKHHMGPDSKSAAKSILASVAEIKADGDNIVFTLNGGNADFPFYASDYHLPIMPANQDGTVDWQSGNRTGPFSIESFDPGIGAKLKRNPNFYKDVWFDEFEVKVIADVAARTNALTSGEIHFMDRCDLKTINMLKRNQDLEINQVTGYGHYIFVMNTQQAPFDNPDVRNALKYAIDRDEILQKVFLGYGTVGNDNPIAPSIQYAINPEPIHSYNPDKVRELLKKAGLDSLTVDLSVSDAAFSGAVDAGTLFKESAAKAGININVIREADDAYWDAVWLKKPFVASYWNGRPVQDWMFTTAYAADAAWNDTFWKNPRFNELLVAARSETDSNKRAAMYAEMQQLLHDDGGLINIVFNSYVSANSKKVAHGPLLSNWDVDGMKIASRWWFA
ncbi:peptide/nickel transport system substrate-binding protein [Dongia mobilis]|uniref:Peptide/nickel transport system substrate-binding protein n=1 Tax=Dongia mobilis TaxID=578943 RepID=A0A4R6WUQ7_9PROT|nr:ABC transporter substrate-binding protein [Dongia mobilis]TDQ80799.1 peptide/nickel transport system substrate-binding protein [Dongia mobilis]